MLAYPRPPTQCKARIGQIDSIAIWDVYNGANMATLNVARAAEVLCVHPKTVCDLIHSGAIPAAKIGRSYVMVERDVMDFVERQVVKQTAERMKRTKAA